MENIWNLFLDVIKDMLIFFGIFIWYFAFLRGLYSILFINKISNVTIKKFTFSFENIYEEFRFISLLLTIGTYAFKALFFK